MKICTGCISWLLKLLQEQEQMKATCEACSQSENWSEGLDRVNPKQSELRNVICEDQEFIEQALTTESLQNDLTSQVTILRLLEVKAFCALPQVVARQTLNLSWLLVARFFYPNYFGAFQSLSYSVQTQLDDQGKEART